jgi:hypothetical protein
LIKWFITLFRLIEWAVLPWDGERKLQAGIALASLSCGLCQADYSRVIL